ncbi:Na+/H+ exchanger AnNHA1 [Kwoniella heveanensis BCC8398]|uniref:Na+/H+ exchanger AnNHA1 n=1 Tax=Kwoniella heveanensis BCC8398 TaxID=1296120 RepID=A0A1B9GJH1_9TREE|nr:Na+/H+ exchanger AnNHA1 [Kwoniella heveanensis BCC8398]
MVFHPFEVSAAHLAYTFLGGFVVIFGMLSLFIKEKLYLGEAPIATVTGIIIGPHCLKLFDPTGWANGHEEITDEITLEVTRVVIAISVFAVGVELPKAYMKRHWRSLAFLLGPVMIWGWMISALLIWALIPGLNFLASLVIAAGVTPTDPILAQSVIGGKFADKHVPAHIRHLLSCESGCNDGAAFPFLYIALYLLLDRSPGHAVGEWFYMTWAYEIVLGCVIGGLLGFVARKFMKYAERKRLIDRQSYVAQYVSLAVLSMGGTALLGSDDLLSAFACGTAFAWDGFFNKATEDAVFSNVIDLLFNCAAFIYIGALIPFQEWNVPDVSLRVWRLVVLAILVLIVRRLPVIVGLYKFIPDIKTFREATFTGWFGPMGVGAVFISTLAKTSLPEGAAEKDTAAVDRLREVIMPITTFLVLSSIVTHGLSIPFFSLGRRVHSITYTRSRGLSMDARGDEPAWTTHARRITPGQQITINRDDDPEEGDMGVRRRDTHQDEIANGEKLASQSSGESSGSGSRTMQPSEEIEMTEKRPSESPRNHQGQAEMGEAAELGLRRPRSRGSRRSFGSRRSSQDEAEGRAEIDDKRGGGDRTPPLAEYREGNHLVIERKKKDSDEVEVEVIRNHFHEGKQSETDKFVHPDRLKHRELDRILHMLPKSLEHATSHVRDEGKDAVDRLGLGLMDPHTATPSIRSTEEQPEYPERRQSRGSERGGEAGVAGSAVDIENENENDYEDVVSDTEEELPRHHNPPAIHVSKGSSSSHHKKRSFRSRFFGKSKRDRSHSPSHVEEGRAPPNPDLLAPPSTSSARPVPILDTEDSFDVSERGTPTGSGLGIPLTRTMSASRSPAIRFAPDVVEKSSDTAPNLTNYGANNPGFKKNPALAMYRSASIQSTGSNKGEGPSVSFAEPKRR